MKIDNKHTLQKLNLAFRLHRFHFNLQDNNYQHNSWKVDLQYNEKNSIHFPLTQKSNQ